MATAAVAYRHHTPSTGITLSPDQEAAYEKFVDYYLDTEADVFVLSGYSGTGKTTLVKEILNRLDSLDTTQKLLDPTYQKWAVYLTATTNKAAQVLRRTVGLETYTIHSLLGLVLKRDYDTGENRLVQRDDASVPDRSLIFIDEASYLDEALIKTIFRCTRECKLVFMGDPAQLTPVGSTKTPIFHYGFPMAELTQVMRQAQGNPVLDLAGGFRDAVNGFGFPKIQLDGYHLQHLEKNAFLDAMLQEFSRPDWHYHDSKFLSWTNNRAVVVNQMISKRLKGAQHFQVGDYAVVNSYVPDRRYPLKTDQLVEITAVPQAPNTMIHALSRDQEIRGTTYEVDGAKTVFVPSSRVAKEAIIKQLVQEGRHTQAMTVESQWADLRSVYGCTINKAQGSTFKKVFIDLNDIARCTDDIQAARLLYVAVSRASDQVIFTGDFA